MELFFKGVLGELNILSICILALLSGFAEELLFRGLLQHYTGIWISSILFGFMHFPKEKKLWPWTAFALVVGLFFAYLMDAYHSLALVTLAHFLINFVNLYILNKKDFQTI